MYQHTRLFTLLVLFAMPVGHAASTSACDEPPPRPQKATAKAATARGMVARPQRDTRRQTQDASGPCNWEAIWNFADEHGLIDGDFIREHGDEWDTLSCRQFAERLVDSPDARAMVCDKDSTRCTRDGRCRTVDSPKTRQFLVSHLVRRGRLPSASGVPITMCLATQASCEASGGCRWHGQCTEKDGRCEVGDDQDCAQSLGCASLGLCALGEDGGCEVETDAHCRQSTACKEDGECSLEAGECVPASGRDCRQSELCTEQHRCTHFGDDCVRVEKARRVCRNGRLCENLGLNCHPIDGDCANPPGFDCAASKACQKRGLCETVVTDGRIECRATEPKHCQQSQTCKKHGHCKVGALPQAYVSDPALAHGCVLSDAGCAQSERCKERGECSKIYVWRAHWGELPTCAATRPEHCKQSRECKEEGKCALLPHPEEPEPVKYCGEAR